MSYKFKYTTARKIVLIEVTDTWGDGKENDPVREVRLYFTDCGSLMAIHDPEHPHERMLHDSALGM